MFADQKIAIVVPAFNESKLIVSAVSKLPDFVDHIFIIDDASTDGTSEAPALIENPKVTVIRHDENKGVGAAIATGYKAALHYAADIAVVMAGDAQMDPQDLPFVLTPILRGDADYVKGDRLSWPGVSKAMPPLRFFGNHVLSVLTRLSSGYPGIRDSQCGYTAVTASMLMRIDLDGLYPRYGFPNDMLAKLHAAGARVVDVPVRPIYGEEVSGISLFTAFVRVPMVLWRSFLWRTKVERQAARRLPGRVDPQPLNSIDG